tara:strand:- start:2635 stop:2919 length:285 start_codon:yes stop_codon:yes gene_type:complete
MNYIHRIFPPKSMVEGEHLSMAIDVYYTVIDKGYVPREGDCILSTDSYRVYGIEDGIVTRNITNTLSLGLTEYVVLLIAGELPELREFLKENII